MLVLLSAVGIIQAYAPTTDQDEEVIEKFYHDLNKTKKALTSHEMETITEDFNTKCNLLSKKKLSLVLRYTHHYYMKSRTALSQLISSQMY